jgi:hypothetical protein
MTLEKANNPNPFMILAPGDALLPGAFRRVYRDQRRYDQMLSNMQQMRGRIAVQEGAVREKDLRPGHRHVMAGDEDSWHLIRTDQDGKFVGCARILVHSGNVGFGSLRVSRTPLANAPEWKQHVRYAVENDIEAARNSEMTVVEPGGWVIDEELRGGADAVAIALSAFAWSQLIGGCLAYVTATVKHRSSAILKRLGGSSLKYQGKELPKYYDPEYECEMEILKFETRSLNSRFESSMAPLRTLLAQSPVVQAEQRQALVELAA